MWTTSHRHEIAVYIAVGLKKQEIQWQFTMEIVLLSIVSFVISISAAVFLSGPVGERIAERIVHSDEKEVYKPVRRDNGYFSIKKTVSEPIELEYQILVRDIISGSVILIMIAVFSAVISVRNMLRIKPRELLQAAG